MKTTIKRILREETTPFLITECVVVGIRLEDGVVLAKNRDRGYKAKVEFTIPIPNSFIPSLQSVSTSLQ